MKKEDPNAPVKKVRNIFVVMMVLSYPLAYISTKWVETLEPNIQKAIYVIEVILIIAAFVYSRRLDDKIMKLIEEMMERNQEDSNTSNKAE